MTCSTSLTGRNLALAPHTNSTWILQARASSPGLSMAEILRTGRSQLAWFVRRTEPRLTSTQSLKSMRASDVTHQTSGTASGPARFRGPQPHQSVLKYRPREMHFKLRHSALLLGISSLLLVFCKSISGSPTSVAGLPQRYLCHWVLSLEWLRDESLAFLMFRALNQWVASSMGILQNCVELAW